MRRCERHQQPAAGFCEKYNVWMCAECRRCQAPQLYCQYRTACLVFADEEETPAAIHGARSEER
jgi:hypothetical protein